MDEMDKNDESSNVEQTTDSEAASKYVRELVSEKLAMDSHELPNVTRLLEEEISKVQSMGRTPIKYVDIVREMPIKVTARVLVPVREFPKFNFVGKLLGPKGNTMKRLQEETMCKISILGRGSMKNPEKENECRESLDPKYMHLSDELHVRVTALAKPTEAHARMAFALQEVKKYLVPDKNDEISQEQFHEMQSMNDQQGQPTRPRFPMKSNFGGPPRRLLPDAGPGARATVRPPQPQRFMPEPEEENYEFEGEYDEPSQGASQYSSQGYNKNFSYERDQVSRKPTPLLSSNTPIGSLFTRRESQLSSDYLGRGSPKFSNESPAQNWKNRKPLLSDRRLGDRPTPY